MKKLPDQYDAAIAGVVERCGQEPFVVYDEEKLLSILAEELGSLEDALEHFEYNIKGAWVGNDTPGFITGFDASAQPDERKEN